MHGGEKPNPKSHRLWPRLGMATKDTKQNLLFLNAAPQISVLSSKRSDLQLHADICECDRET